uniref:AAA family ATPase n=1 Tax=Roseihalotalea indica TaxID=2867963 RepID=A0AA49GHZ2_9BACT|nr:AAA family ATPase [Tunicatimonas sp. TK19036]
MRITKIEITNYKAFYGSHTISLDQDGKNLMVYGENGSGKSSLFIALQKFFQSSVEQVDIDENIFVSSPQKNTASIKITLKESPQSSKSTDYELRITQNRLISGDIVTIAEANKIKGFFDYRSLLKTHLNHEKQVNLFNILIEEILYHAINRFTNQELGREWKIIYKDTHTKRQTEATREAIKGYINKFNDGVKEKLQDIESDTNKFLEYFFGNIKVSLHFLGIQYVGRRNLKNNDVELRIEYCDTHIPKHQFFLNEARLSALAISLYLASIRVNPTKGELKVLVLDDLLIGLDMSNRLPLLKILKENFVEVERSSQFQVIMTTYDKIWYELVRNYFNEDNWKYVEIYARKLDNEDFEIPIVHSTNGYLEKAKHYLDERDYKASAVYIRTEFERLVKKICEERYLSVLYKKNSKDVNTDEYWRAITEQTNISIDLIKEIEIHRGTVMNPFSHDDLEKPEFRKELEDTIASIVKLTETIPAFKKTVTIQKLGKEIDKLKKELDTKEQTIRNLKSNR